VREDWELAIARLEGAVHIPMGEVPARLDELDRDREIVVMCRSGGRSARWPGYLEQQGFPASGTWPAASWPGRSRSTLCLQPY
jgi:rhodanese-related sulfurtransferase